MSNQQNYSISAEDLEQAASVRLFEKAAAAEGINLSELSESQVEELYSNYQSQSEENTMNEEIIDLFEKQAAYEGVDLESLNDEELAHVYNNFITNLSAQLEETGEEEEEEVTKEASAEEINAFLFEKTAYVVDLVKEAAESKSHNPSHGGYPGGDSTPKADAPKADAPKGADDAAEGLLAKGRKAGAKALEAIKTHKKKSIGGALATTAAGGTYLYKRNKKKKEMEKEASADLMVNAFDEYIQEEHGVGVDSLDQDTFNNSYNEFLDMVANDIVADYQEEEEAYEKLAEAEILGRHMARAYMDEFEKEAGRMSDAADYVSDKARRSGELLSGKHVRSNVKEVAGDEAGAMDKMKAYGRILAGKADNDAMTSEARKSLASQAGAAATAVGAGVGGKKMYDKRKEQSKEASMLEAQEYLIDQGINPFTGDWLTEDDIYELEKEAGRVSDTMGKAKKHVSDRLAKAKKRSDEFAMKRDTTDIEEGPRRFFGRFAGKKKFVTKRDKTRARDYVRGYGKEFGKEIAGGTVVAGGGAYALSKKKGKKEQEKKASGQIEDLAFDRANEFIEFGKEAGFDGSLIDGFAVEILEDHGYDVSPLFE